MPPRRAGRGCAASPGSRGRTSPPARAGGLCDRRDRVADILPLLVLGHAAVEEAPAREAVRDERRVAPLPLLDQDRVVVSAGPVERQGRRDAVLVQDGKEAKEADAIAVLVVAVAADIGKRRLVPAPQPLGAAQRADRPRRLGWHLPVPVLEVDEDGEGDAGVVRPSEHRARDNRGPRRHLLVHARGSLCRHSSTALPWRVMIKSCGCGPRRRLLVMVQLTLRPQAWRRHIRTYYDSLSTATAPPRGPLNRGRPSRSRSCARCGDALRSRNVSHFVACIIWRRHGVSLLRGRAHRLQRHEPFRCLLRPMNIFFDLLQTAIN